MGIARSAMASSNTAHSAKATRIRVTAKFVEPIADPFGKRNMRNPPRQATRRVSSRLLCLRRLYGCPVDFDDDSTLEANEVGDMTSQDDSSPKFRALASPVGAAPQIKASA
jgi:hypothetical protein